MQSVLAAKYKFKKAWKWPPRVESWITSRLKGFSLHVCCGSSTIGDVRVDLHQETATIKGDMYHLPFKREVFDSILCDPPWNMPYHKRHLLTYELRDSLKPGGTLLYNALWYPKNKALRIIDVYIPKPKDVHFHRNFAIIAHAIKINGQLDPYLQNNT
jgi:hypothetical protein